MQRARQGPDNGPPVGDRQPTEGAGDAGPTPLSPLPSPAGLPLG